MVFVIVWVAGSSLMHSAFAGESDTPARMIAEQQGDGVFEQTIQPFLDTYCLNCHSGSVQRGNVDLAALDPATIVVDSQLWRHVHEQVAHRVMPPPDKAQPSEAARIAVAEWIDHRLDAAFAEMPQRAGPALTRRLTGKEFDRTIRDLTGIDEAFSAEFPADAGGGEGFTNNASTLFMSSLLMTKLLNTSQLVASQATVTWAGGIRFGKQAQREADAEAFPKQYQRLLTERGVFKDDADQLERYLVLLWQYEQAKRRDRGLTPAAFASEQNAEPAYVDRLYQMLRIKRAPQGSAKGVVDFYRAWDQARRIRDRRGAEEQSLQQVREIAKQCVQVFKQHRGDFTGRFPTADTKRKLIDAGDTEALEKLVFFMSEQQLLDGLEGDGRKVFEGQWIASRLAANDRGVERDAAKFAGEMIAEFAERAWRRPVEDNELAEFVRRYRDLAKEGTDFQKSMRIMIRGVLVSPHFIFRFEVQPRSGAQVEVGPYEMASRLSYFLWGSLPDEQLLELAAQDKLQDEAVLREEVKRMLNDKRCQALAESFFGEWLGYVDLLTQDGPDTGQFPKWKPELAEMMVEQAKRTISYMIQEDRPYTDLIDADYGFVNGALASFLGIHDVHGDLWRRIPGAPQSRYGVAGLPAIHVMTSHPNRTSPVKRGDWLLATLLGTPTPPPPPNVGELEEEAAIASAASLREQLEAHRANTACASCHNRIDPLGFPLERFDALGRARPGQVDLKGELPDGTVFEGPKGLRDVLLSRKELLRRQLVIKTLGFALGREIQLDDEPVVRHIDKALGEDPRLSVLFTEVVLSPAFRMKTRPTE